jgi:threonine dehydratase
MSESSSQPEAVTRPDVQRAESRIRPYIRRTPLLQADGSLWFKCEFLQAAGVFKARGAFNRLLAARERGELDPEIGVAVASGGNAGLATAYAATRLGVRSTVFVPVTAPEVKVARLEHYGAVVRQVGNEYAEAQEAAAAYIRETGALASHAYDLAEVAAGAGTLAEEILEDEPSIDTIIVAIGGGGLFAGVAASAEGRARVVAVEPEKSSALHSALAAGEPVDVTVGGVAADALGARRVGDIAFSVATRTHPTSVLVSDQAIVEARHHLWSEYRIPAEHGAATAYAALLSGAYTPAEGERVCVVVCGANTDPSTLG